MNTLFILAVLWLAPVVIGAQIAKEFKIKSLKTPDDFALLFFPIFNWFAIFFCISEALSVWVNENE